MNSLTRTGIIRCANLTVPFVMLLSGCMSNQTRPEIPEVQTPRIEWPKEQLNGSIYQQGRNLSLFQSRAARQIGDIITVILEEKTQASKKANTKVAKNSDMEVKPNLLFGKANLAEGLGLDLEQKNSFDGTGTSDQSNTLTGSVTCVVTEVLPNGYLMVQGQKKLTLNRGDEYITISGIVRPDDVADDNTVPSKRVANAQIAYTGKGELADSNQMGWLSRFFFTTIWPF